MIPTHALDYARNPTTFIKAMAKTPLLALLPRKALAVEDHVTVKIAHGQISGCCGVVAQTKQYTEEEWEAAQTIGTFKVPFTERTGSILTQSGDVSQSQIDDGMAAFAALLNDGLYTRPIDGVFSWMPYPYENRPVVGEPLMRLGVDLARDPTRLAGMFYDATCESIVDGFIDAISLVCIMGGDPHVILANGRDVKHLARALQTRREYETDSFVSEDLGLSFESIVINSVRGPVHVVRDDVCPVGVAAILQLNTWSLRFTAPFVSVSDSLDLSASLALTCTAPGKNGVTITNEYRR